METNVLKYFAFIKAVEYENITKAAEELNYSQSSISRMIGDLEKEWKCTLLERNHSGVSLTSDGHKIFPYVQSLCSEYAKLQRQVEEVQGLQTGLVRIAAFSSVATQWLPNMIQEFQKTYPNIHFGILTGEYHEIEQWILEGKADCGFLINSTDPEIETVFLEEDRFMVVLPEGHPMAGCEKFPIRALANYSFILQGKDGKTETAEVFARCGVDLTASYMALDDYAIMAMVEKGLGISILPELILRRCPYRVVTKELDVPASRRICLAYRRQSPLPVAAKRFLEYLPCR